MTLGKEMLKQARFYTKFEVIGESIRRINPEFSLCDILVAYHGDNRNHSSISKEVFEKCLWTIYGVPIVGEWVRKAENQNEETWGSHGGKLIWDDQGIRYEQTTKPFGFVTEDAAKNAKWVTITEANGHTQHEYLKLEGCILWNARYEECNSILEENFGQSMEISVNDGYWRDDDYFEIKDFNFSALCILGTAEPCFESAMISRHYELSQFKQDFQLMMSEYKKSIKLNAEVDESTSALIDNVDDGANESQANHVEETEVKMEAEEKKEGAELANTSFSEVCAKINLLMAERTYRHSSTGKQYGKHIVLSVSEEDKFAVVLDRELDYAAKKIPYVVTQTEEGLMYINIDFDNATDMVVGAVDATESIFNVFGEVQTMSQDYSEYNVSVHTNTLVNELTSKLAEVSDAYESARTKISEMENHLSIYEAEKQQFAAKNHKDIIDALIATRREEMGQFSEYLEYCLKIDYNKSIEEIEKELKEIHYNFMVLGQQSNKHSFSAKPVAVVGDITLSPEIKELADRYGEDIARAMQKK